ncbi:MAG: biotin--[acetyl-CoA-carboxylase] ligase [Planctomycetota bacterium]|nr:biotin--[acetyl-CoA-carboxylase] ligase [Planctomycetota bacterium]
MGGSRSSGALPDEPPLEAWAEPLEAACAACPRLGVRHVRVLAETASTQDAAWAACAGRSGWLVLAGRQHAGRGRLGRVWADTADRGLAMTFVLPAQSIHSVAVGVAVCLGIRECVPEPERLGLRWPNDVVERESGRKIAGVLIEVKDGVALVGIGINVRQADGEFDPALTGRAVSIRQLGSKADRLCVAERVVAALDGVAGREQGEIVRAAMAMDTIVGTRRRFVHDGREVEGDVVSISLDGAIEVAIAGGGVVKLPAATTSIVHE